jgi:5-methylcytosine-specific restriction endonuclease McrA
MLRNNKGQFVKGMVPSNKGVPCPDWIKKRISRANKGRAAWNKSNIILICPICGKSYKTIPYLVAKGWGKTCSMSCRNKSRPDIYAKKGKNANSYKNGISLYRSYIKKEKCERCNSDKFLMVHHRDFYRTNNEIANLQVVCKSCHQVIHDAFLNFSSSSS